MKKQYSFESTLTDIPLEPGKSSHYPFMVEFTGTPEAGKTTCIAEVKRRLEAEHFKVSCVRESATVIPEDILTKGSFEAHLVMRLTTVMSIIVSALSEGSDFLLIDRGICDGIFFTRKFIHDNPKWTNECEGLIRLLDSLVFLLPNVSLIFSCSTEESIRRRGGEGKLVTKEFIDNYNQMLENAHFSPQVVSYRLDTTRRTPEQIVEKVMIVLKGEYKKRPRT